MIKMLGGNLGSKSQSIGNDFEMLKVAIVEHVSQEANWDCMNWCSANQRILLLERCPKHKTPTLPQENQ